MRHGCAPGVRERTGRRAATRHRTAAFFDLDKTIIAKSSTLAFSKPFQAGGLISRRAVLRSAYAQFVYLVGGADHDQMEKMRAFMSQLCAGWDVETVKDIVADTLHNIVDPIVYDEAVSLIEEHHLAGRDVIIVSTSGSEVVGADRRDARRRPGDRDPDGGRRRQVHRRDRLLRLRREQGRGDPRAGRRGTATTSSRCYAYSDSVTDVPMLEVVGHPHAVNPDKELRRVATGKGWPILVFAKPVALRQPDAAPHRQADARRADGRRRRGRRRRDPGQHPQRGQAV